MDKKARATQQKTYDLSFPFWEEDTDIIEPWELERLFASLCKRFAFYIEPKPPDSRKKSESCVIYNARIHLNDRTTPTAIRPLLMEGCNSLQNVTITPTGIGHRDAAGFYRFVGEEMIKHFGPMWMDFKKVHEDAEKAKKAALVKEARDRAKEAKKEAALVERAKKKAKRDEELQNALPPVPGRWVSMLVLNVDTQEPLEVDVVIVEEKTRKNTQDNAFVRAMLRTDAGKTIPIGMLDDPISLKEHWKLCSHQADHSMLQMVDITILDFLRARHKEKFDATRLWDAIVELKRCDCQGWKPGIKVKVVVFAHERPDESRCGLVTFRYWKIGPNRDCIIEVV